MKTTITIDDDLVKRAKEFSGITDNPSLIRRAIEYVIAYETAVLRAEETNDFREVERTVQRLYDNIDEE